jgi:CO/xanthine dehydrogenase FAD-binding subunit
VAQAVEAAAAALEPTSDLHASAAYRRRVAVLLGTRAIGDAVADAQEKGAGR